MAGIDLKDVYVPVMRLFNNSVHDGDGGHHDLEIDQMNTETPKYKVHY